MAVGWAGAVGMALCGSKLHGLWEDFVTWQAATPDQRAQWKRTRRLNGRRFDCAPDQMGSK